MGMEIVICKAFKHLRFIRGISQDKVLLDTGISVSNYESSYKMPGTETFSILSRYLDFDPGRLLTLVNTSFKTGIDIETLIDGEVKSAK